MTKSARVSLDDLSFAIDWLNAYDSDGEKQNEPRRQRLIAWLEQAIDTRQIDKLTREFSKRTGLKPGKVRAKATELYLSHKNRKTTP